MSPPTSDPPFLAASTSSTFTPTRIPSGTGTETLQAYHLNLSRHVLSLLHSTKNAASTSLAQRSGSVLPKQRPGTGYSAASTDTLHSSGLGSGNGSGSGSLSRRDSSSPYLESVVSTVMTSNGSGSGNSAMLSSVTSLSDLASSEGAKDRVGNRLSEVAVITEEAEAEKIVTEEEIEDRYDLTARPEQFARFTPVLQPASPAMSNAEASSSRLNPPSPSPPSPSHARRSSDPSQSALPLRSPEAPPSTREEEHRSAWLKEGHKVWTKVPAGFALNIKALATRSRRNSDNPASWNTTSSQGDVMERPERGRKSAGLDGVSRGASDLPGELSDLQLGHEQQQGVGTSKSLTRAHSLHGEAAPQRDGAMSIDLASRMGLSLGSEDADAPGPSNDTWTRFRHDEELRRFSSRSSLPVSTHSASDSPQIPSVSGASFHPLHPTSPHASNQETHPGASFTVDHPPPSRPSSSQSHHPHVPHHHQQSESMLRPIDADGIPRDPLVEREEYEARRDQRLKRKQAELARKIEVWVTGVIDASGEEWGRIREMEDIDPTPLSPGPARRSSMALHVHSNSTNFSTTSSNHIPGRRMSSPATGVLSLGPKAVSRQLHQPLYIIPPTPDTEQAPPTFPNPPGVAESATAASAQLLYPSARQHARKHHGGGGGFKGPGGNGNGNGHLDIALRLRALEALVGERPTAVSGSMNNPERDALGPGLRTSRKGRSESGSRRASRS